MTVMIPSTPPPEQDFMTVEVPATAITPVEHQPPSPAELCDQSPADLGDRLE